MKFQIVVNGQKLLLSHGEFDELLAAMEEHELSAFRDGETRHKRVRITEVGQSEKAAERGEG